MFGADHRILVGQLAGKAAIKRFHAEAEAAAKLQHPGIVAIHEVGVHQGQHYFSSEYIQGQSLAAVAVENGI
jgi:eukaryotic-like serine/threonine-protein kinase